MTSILLYDLAAHSLQIAVLIAAAAVLARLFGLRASVATLAYWQILLVACLVLPLCQPWHAPAATPFGEATRADLSGGGEVVAAGWSIPEVVGWAIVAGALARAAWLVLGLWSLQRLRRRASAAPPGLLPVESAQERVGARAEFLLSSQAAVPITFGLFRPAVVLPPAVLEMPAHTQEAILYHELLHVRRRDWLQALVEEAVRAAFWFHPGVWWLVGRIHLTREQVVDRAVVGLTRSPQAYVEALLEVARARTQGPLVPASLFLRRGRLRQRVAEIFQEVTMSRSRLLFSLAASAALLLPVAGAAVWALPLQAEPAVLLEDHAPAPASGPKVDPRVEELQRLARQIKQLEKAILDPQTSGELLAELKRQLLQLRIERAERKAERPLFRLYDPLAKDDKDDEDC